MTQDSRQKNIVLITGSVRAGSLTTTALRLIASEFSRLGCSVSVIDPIEVKISSLGQPFPDILTKKYTKLVEESDGVVLCTPEYNGSYSAVLKAVIEAIGFPSPLDGKTVALVGVASGGIGAIKALEHLRGVCAHCGAHVLPFALSVKEAHLVLDPSGKCKDEKIGDLLKEVAAKLTATISI